MVGELLRTTKCPIQFRSAVLVTLDLSHVNGIGFCRSLGDAFFVAEQHDLALRLE